SFELTAFSMMFLDGYIGAPPTSTVISAKAGESPPDTAKLMAAANAKSRTVNMQFLLQAWRRPAARSDEPWRRHLVRPGLMTGNYGRAAKSCARRLAPLVGRSGNKHVSGADS